MNKITKLFAREIIDSRGNPTIEVELILNNEFKSVAQIPSGASTGTYEACELRDKDKDRYSGKGVTKAVRSVNKIINDFFIDKDFANQEILDMSLIDLDNSKNKTNLGANAMLGVSIAFAKALAKKKKLKLFQYFSEISNTKFAHFLPIPMMNILNGGKHADSNVDIQEFMIAPTSAKTYKEALRAGVEVYHSLKQVLTEQNLVTAVGDEGGFAPNLSSNEEALKLIMQAIKRANYKPGKDIYICLDVAANELYEDGLYSFEGEKKTYTAKELINYYKKLIKAYPIISIEDGLAEDDWENWHELTALLHGRCEVVGDDLYVTNTERLKKGIEYHSSTAILIKPNQIGTITETIRAVRIAHKNHMTVIISHRSGETEDTTIADLAVGLKTKFIKTGAPCRIDRVAKYNQLLRIEDHLDIMARYQGLV